MPRRTFFSFHYKPDVWRAWNVRNSWQLNGQREGVGFFDSSAIEEKQRVNGLKAFLDQELTNTSVTCVLLGSETAGRRWVRYETVRSFCRGNGILAIRIHGISDNDGKTSVAGNNLLDALAYKIADNQILFYEKDKTGSWVTYSDIGSISVASVPYNFAGNNYHTFATIFPTYDWIADAGRANLPIWIERAATFAKK